MENQRPKIRAPQRVISKAINLLSGSVDTSPAAYFICMIWIFVKRSLLQSAMEVSKRSLVKFPKEREREKDDDSEPSEPNSTSIKGGGQQGTTCKSYSYSSMPTLVSSASRGICRLRVQTCSGDTSGNRTIVGILGCEGYSPTNFNFIHKELIESFY
jgi:hypothetical protein